MKVPIRSLRVLEILGYVRALLAIAGTWLSVLLFVYVYAFYHGGIYAFKPYNDEGWALFTNQLHLIMLSLLLFCGLMLIAALSIVEARSLRSLRRYRFCRSVAFVQAVLGLGLAVSLLVLLVEPLRLFGLAGFLVLLILSIQEIGAFVFMSGSSVRVEFKR
jgi:hypothetical protein